MNTGKCTSHPHKQDPRGGCASARSIIVMTISHDATSTPKTRPCNPLPLTNLTHCQGLTWAWALGAQRPRQSRRWRQGQQQKGHAWLRTSSVECGGQREGEKELEPAMHGWTAKADACPAQPRGCWGCQCAVKTPTRSHCKSFFL